MKGREEMAAALVDVDEVRVEAIVGEGEGVKVRPEVSCFPIQLISKEMCTYFHEQFNMFLMYSRSRCE